MTWEEIASVPALLTVSQKLVLAHLASGLPEGSTVVEVGPFRGGSTRILAGCARGCRVFTIDLYDNIDRSLVRPGEDCELVLGGAAEFARRYPGMSVDLLFIDGDHSFHGARTDYFTLRPFLREGAVIAFHDYAGEYLGVRWMCDGLVEHGLIRSINVVDGMLLARQVLQERDGSPDLFDGSVARTTLADLPREEPPTEKLNCREVIARLGRDARCIGKGAFARYFARFFGLDPLAFIDSTEADGSGIYVVCSHYLQEIRAFLGREHGVRSCDVVDANRVLAYGMLRDLLDGGRVLSACSDDAFERRVIERTAVLPEDVLLGMYRKGLLVPLFKRTSV